ncbi:MAG: hypothetical protein Q8934_05670 [Bacillota bacterium]|nr:hypothetical protein [Bacillota bacterium]
MGWTLAILFVISAVLLIISFSKSLQASKVEQKKIDMVHISVMKEINDVKESIRNIELDSEVLLKEAGIQLSPEDILLRREVLDLYRRSYSIESIADKKQVSEGEIQSILAPFQTTKDERRKAVNEN